MRELSFREMRLFRIFRTEIAAAYDVCVEMHELKELVLTCEIQNHKARVEAERLRLSFEHHDNRARKIRRALEKPFEDEFQASNKSIHTRLIEYSVPLYNFFF